MDSEKTKETIEKGAEVAFPVQFETDNLKLFGTGMTLLDYFAAKAMQGIMSNEELRVKMLMDMRHNKSHKKADDSFAEEYYSIANVMLKEREKHLK